MKILKTTKDLAVGILVFPLWLFAVFVICPVLRGVLWMYGWRHKHWPTTEASNYDFGGGKRKEAFE